MSQVASPWESFFYYGNDTLENETLYDMTELLMQPKRSLYYFRRGSGGLNLYENNPNGLALSIFMRYEITSAIGYRNTIVVAGENGFRDRRVAVSQQSIKIIPAGNNVDVDVLYFLFADFEKPRSNSFKLLA